MFDLLAADADNEYAMIDSTIVRAHQHSAGPRRKTAKIKRSAQQRWIDTRIHTLVDALGILSASSPGQAHDPQGSDALIPHMKADTLLADKARPPARPASSREKATARSRAPTTRTSTRPVISSKTSYCRLEKFRAVATSYDKTETNFLASIHLAAAIVRLN
jgi:transposase